MPGSARPGGVPLAVKRPDREMVVRALTFWLRPAFILRVVARFQQVAGFDRAIALASSALTALIPLSLISGALLPHIGGEDAGPRIIQRYDLTGGGAEAVEDVLAPTGGTDTTIGVLGALLLLVAILSFSRAVQRLFEQTWELAPLSVRNSVNGLIWIGGLTLYLFYSGVCHALLDQGRLDLPATIAVTPVAAVFLIWSGWILSARRIPWRALIPFGVTGAVALGAYAVAGVIWVPHLFETYATRYGVIGAVLAMTSALFGIMLVVVASAALGCEVHEELKRIRRGERPADREVQHEWARVIDQARSRWDVVRRRSRRAPQ
jgi:membrane protein